MTWKYPTRSASQPGPAEDGPTLTNEEWDKVMRGKTKSTYQQDYKGLPPGM